MEAWNYQLDTGFTQRNKSLSFITCSQRPLPLLFLPLSSLSLTSSSLILLLSQVSLYSLLKPVYVCLLVFFNRLAFCSNGSIKACNFTAYFVCPVSFVSRSMGCLMLKTDKAFFQGIKRRSRGTSFARREEKCLVMRTESRFRLVMVIGNLLGKRDRSLLVVEPLGLEEHLLSMKQISLLLIATKLDGAWQSIALQDSHQLRYTSLIIGYYKKYIGLWTNGFDLVNKTGVWRVGGVQCVWEESIKRKKTEEFKRERWWRLDLHPFYDWVRSWNRSSTALSSYVIWWDREYYLNVGF